MTDRAPATPIEVGHPGFALWGGYVDTEWDKRLRGTKGPKAYREMAEGNAVVGGALSAWVSLVLAAGYHIEPADESPAAEEAATFLDECFADMEGAWSDTFRDLADYRPFGFALLNLVYKWRGGVKDDPATTSRYDDGRIGWARWSPRAPETIELWQFDPAQSRALAAIQRHPVTSGETILPLNACLHVVARPRKGSPEGLSVLRNAYDAWYKAKHIERIESVGIERDLAGFPVVRVPAAIIAAGGAVYQSYLDLGANIRRDEQGFALLPSDRDEAGHLLYDLSLLTSGGQRQIDTTPVIARYNLLMLRSLLCDFMALGDNAVGSYAQSTNRTDLFMDAIQGELASIEDAINQQAVLRLWRLNGLPLETMPRFRFNPVRRRDAKAFAETIVSLAAAGVVDVDEPDVRRAVYEVVGLPMPEETEEDQDAEESGGNPTPEPADEQTEPGDRDENENDAGMRIAAAEQRTNVTADDLDVAVAWFDRWARAKRPALVGALDAEAA